ncbi:hypothetical protein A1507_18970 [Methylomonas koyamae]|uniref:Uncharacterized protein n=2 Tax=Methylomonas koyamae TaxID=702114 RepID=A0A177N4M7_9GAMM|nr:hypothetical protein A1507_18970 [Methylomonas koyamae]
MDLPTGHKGRIPVFINLRNAEFIQMIGGAISNMKFKVSSNANDAPANVGSILSAHFMDLFKRRGLPG